MEANSGYFLSGDVTLLTFFAFFFDFWADSVIKLRPNSPALLRPIDAIFPEESWVLIRMRADVEIFESAKKKISGNVWTGPLCFVVHLGILCS